jgi:two-component system response regulator FixJ
MSTPPVVVYIVVEPSGFRARAFVSSEEFLAVYDRLSPGVIMLDLKLPGMGGASLVEELVRRGCWWPIIILTAYPTTSDVERVRRAGAVNILRKPIKGAVILATLAEAQTQLGAAWLDKPNPAIRARFAMLTAGERAVLDGLRDGLMNKQIAGRCAVSERTVRTRVQRILRKTGAGSREHLLQLAVTAGMPVKPPV